MGFHALDIIIVVGLALLIFGPKTLQSLSHNAGRGLGQAKDAKDKLLAELPMEDLAKVTKTVSRVPLSPQQAARRLMSSALTADEKTSPAVDVTPEEPVQGPGY